MKACVFTLGCKLNEVESDSILHALEERGYETTRELGYADLYLLNTCAVTAEAERKSRQAIARMRKFNPAAPVVVFGCAAQKDPAAFSEREGVTFVSGAMRKDKIPALLGEKGVLLEAESAFCELPDPKRTRTRAYLRVQDGCDRFCSYCVIPYLRGRSRSRSLESAAEEARRCGAKEIVLTGVDLAAYRDGDRGLGDLLLALKEVPARVRLGSLEVSAITPAFLDAALEAGNVCPHFHLSLQSGSDAVLKKMNRRYTRAEYLAACAAIRERFPDAAITTDIIVGFPTETEEDFCDSLSIVEEAALARVHAFPFSPREGTNAFKLPDLPAAVKRARMARMLAACRKAEEDFGARFENKILTALFEEDGGYTENYIRVYSENAKEGGMYEVRLQKRLRDGYAAEIVKEK